MHCIVTPALNPEAAHERCPTTVVPIVTALEPSEDIRLFEQSKALWGAVVVNHALAHMQMLGC